MADSTTAATKYVNGAGIKVLYERIKNNITNGVWVLNGAVNSTNYVKVIEHNGQFTGNGNQSMTDRPVAPITTMWFPGYALKHSDSDTNLDYKQLISTTRTGVEITESSSLGDTKFYKDTFFTDYLRLSTGSDTQVLLGNGSQKALSDLVVGSATNADTATKADSVKVVDSSAVDSNNLVLWGSTGASGEYNTVVRRPSVYITQAGQLVDKLCAPNMTLTNTQLTQSYGDWDVVPKRWIVNQINTQITSGISSVIKLKKSYSNTNKSDWDDVEKLKEARVGDAHLVADNGLEFKGSQVDQGDMIICTKEDRENGTAVEWTIIQRNIPEALSTDEIGILLDPVDAE